MKPEWREILKRRNVDRVAVMSEPVGSINTAKELVREGVMVWVNRVDIGFNVDIYQLTVKGVKLCHEHRIEGR